jgi:hypothetical protein
MLSITIVNSSYPIRVDVRIIRKLVTAYTLSSFSSVFLASSTANLGQPEKEGEGAAVEIWLPQKWHDAVIARGETLQEAFRLLRGEGEKIPV